MNNPKLEDWSVTLRSTDPYAPPEHRQISLQGEVFGHPRFEDGKRITTSFVVEVNGPLVTTMSGTVYTLTYPNADYIKWCGENGCHIPTPEEPIKLS